MTDNYFDSINIRESRVRFPYAADSEDIAKQLERFRYNIQLREKKIARYENLLKEVFNQKRASEDRLREQLLQDDSSNE